jgi:hypothetical protein
MCSADRAVLYDLSQGKNTSRHLPARASNFGFVGASRAGQDSVKWDMQH